MHWQTISTMIFAVTTVFGGLVVMLGIAFLKHNPSDEL